ncbi:FecCD family ABC transporter permease [Marinicrinis lubricantis]
MLKVIKLNSRTPSSGKQLMTLGALIIGGIILLLLGVFFSITVGAADIRISTVFQAIFNYQLVKDHMILWELRLPRTLVGIFIGANLAVAGAIMQGMTRNPLASPQVFGINAGASLIVVAGVVFFPSLPYTQLILLAFIGAAFGGVAVYALSRSDGGMSPVKLALGGMALHMFLSSITEGIIMFHEHSTASVLYWLAGGIDGRDWTHVRILFPWTVIGLIAALFLARSLTMLNLGEDVAKGLGQNNRRVYFFAGLTVILLAGASVAVAGPIGFVGLIIPHIVRSLVGVDYRVVIPFSALFGALLLTYADVASRFIAYPFDSPVGIVTAFIGAPFFLYLARQGGRLK